GNTLMDQFVQLKYPGKYYDQDAEIAASGEVSEALLAALLDHPFFKADFPKTTGPELFNLDYLYHAMERSGCGDLSNADIMASLAKFSSQAIIQAISYCSSGKGSYEIYLSGGGMYNPLLVSDIETYVGRKLKYTSNLGIHPDAKEAVLFALLANETVAGGHTSFADHPGVPSITMGKVSFPA